MALWLLARRQLASHRARTALTALGVACGVALVVAIEIVNGTTLGAFRDAIEDLAGRAALQVRGPGRFPDELAETLRDLPGIDHAVPVLSETFFAVDPPAAGEALAVFAADVTDGHAIKTLKLVDSGEQVVDDPLSFLVDPASIVLTEDFAARTGIAEGDVVPLRTPVGVKRFTVRGILPSGGVGRAFGGNLIIMDVIGAQAVLERDRLIDQIDVTVEPDADVDAVETRLAALLPRGLEVLRPARRGEQIDGYLRSYRTLLSGISGLALLAAVFVVGGAVATSVAARRTQLGLLRCVGAMRRDVLRLVVGEAVLTGAVGVLLGVPLGLGLARLLLDTVGESAELVFAMTFFRAAMRVDPSVIGLGAAVGLGAGLLAAFLPARDAVAIPPLAAVRGAVAAPTTAHWPAPGLVLASVVVAAVAVFVEIRFESAWAGNVAALAVDVALVCLFMRHCRRVAAVVLEPLRTRLGIGARLAIDRLRRMPNQLALAGGVLGLGLGLTIMAATLARSFEESVLDFIRHQVRADVVVASTVTRGWIEAPLEAGVGAALAAMPEVAAVERLRLAEHDHEGSRISLDSLDAAAFGRPDDFRFVDGEPAAALPRVARGEAVLVSQNLARRLALAAGDALTLATPDGPFTVPIAGVVVDYVSPRGSVVMVRDLYVARWHDPSVTRFHVTLRTAGAIDAFRHAVAAGPGATQALKVLTQRELYAYHRDAVRRAFRFTDAVRILPLIVAALGLAEALLAVALDRRRELGLLRASGATRRQVAGSVVWEALGVGALGLTGGIAMGLVLSLLWVRINFTHQLGWAVDFHFAWASVGVAALAALLVCVPAGVLPARRIAALPLLEGLRHE